ncbi:MAG: YbdD/YjiX family protein [Gammaproteobacteria bacterium]
MRGIDERACVPAVFRNTACAHRVAFDYRTDGDPLVTRLLQRLRILWLGLRHMVGDDAYENYLAHWRRHHVNDGEPLSRKQFFRQEQARRWDGIRRCC